MNLSVLAEGTSARRRLLPALAMTLAALSLCTAARADITVDVGRGPVLVRIPASYDPAVPAPLLVLLHGFTGSGDQVANYFDLDAAAEANNLIYCAPDGSQNFLGFRFWNATDACCDLDNSGVDDSGYLRDLVEEIQRQLTIDDKRIHAAGHSNGGFMSYRLACDHADLFASIASLAGATFKDETFCTPSEAVHVLQVHGTSDGTILYGGGDIGGVEYPGAVETVRTWVGYDTCTNRKDSGFADLDLDDGIPGTDATVEKWVRRCDDGGSGELWTIMGGQHSPNLSNDFSWGVVEWLLDHPKPGDWVDEGFGLAGSNGVPNLVGTGAVTDGDIFTLRLTNSLEDARGFLVVGLTDIFAPFSGGTLVPFPDLIRFERADLAGTRTIRTTWPTGAPPGFSVWYQYWMMDPAGVKGFSASNAVKSVTN